MTISMIGSELPVTLIGHPYATVGMGEQMRSHIAACQAVGLPHKVLDIYCYDNRNDPDHRRLVDPVETHLPQGGIRIFHVNGDEVEPVIQAFERRGGSFEDGYNIIVPAWELPTYPEPWAKRLKEFNEVWALSEFIADSLAAAGLASRRIGQAVEVPLGYFLPRKYFGIRESAFVLLHFFDLSSFAARKNPEAVLTLLESFRKLRPFDDVQLVLKVKKGAQDGEDWLRPIRERIPEALCLSQPMSSLETRSLINCCDCFVSLHRAEGFGRGTGEAMFLGRLAMGTGWSGNLDYMTKENSLLVRYRVIPVGAGEYPFGKGQMWADPDIDHALTLLRMVVDDPARASAIAAAGRRNIRLDYGFRTIGLRILDRVTEIMKAEPALTSPIVGEKATTSLSFEEYLADDVRDRDENSPEPVLDPGIERVPVLKRRRNPPAQRRRPSKERLSEFR